MGNYEARARLLWRLSQSGIGTTLTAGTGNSGSYTAGNINAVTAVDLRAVTDLALMVFVASTVAGGSSLVVNLNTYDAAGNLFPNVMATAAITATNTGKASYGGLFSGGASQIVYPEWGQISWTVTGAGASLAGVEISLYGR